MAKEKTNYEALSVEDLKNRLVVISDELMAARTKIRLGQFKRFTEVARLKKDVARIQTSLRARELKKAS